MTERPILFSAAMVRAVLEGRKTQTRRIVKSRGLEWLGEFTPEFVADPGNALCPYGQPGDQLWVRETWQSLVEYDHLAPSRIPEGSAIQYPATYDGWASKHRPSIHMCRWMSRIHLEVTGVRVERLNAISEADAIAEGCGGHSVGAARGWYHDLWDKINGAGSWGANPWVWVVEFRQIERIGK